MKIRAEINVTEKHKIREKSTKLIAGSLKKIKLASL